MLLFLGVALVARGQSFAGDLPAYDLDSPDLASLEPANSSTDPAARAQGDPSSSASEPAPATIKGTITRNIHRSWEDQKGIWLAPFQTANLKWDGAFLAGLGGLLASDHYIERKWIASAQNTNCGAGITCKRVTPDFNTSDFEWMANATIGTFGGARLLLYVYGRKHHNPHLMETGELGMEALADAFAVYAPLQFLCARERPGVGNNQGDFWVNHDFNTSFPAGHSMFTTAMATMLAYEYPQPWVQALSYGAAATVTAGRFMGHDHWPSDLFAGNTLGFLISRHVFHERCDPELSLACRPRRRRQAP